MANFDTPRLRCRSLSLSEYQIFEEGLEPEWENFTNPYGHLVIGPSPLRHRIPKVKKNLEFAEIGLVLAIEKETKSLIGSAGFHDLPNSDGMIEIGFGIVPAMQNKGFGQELLRGMWQMILEDSIVKILRYTVSPENLPSVHIIEKLNFNLVGTQFDEEDGPELIYEMSSADYIKNTGGDEEI